ncbi:bifunctional isocitrate dehydrogenase kinase/phosphatase [Algoriphagus halophytocola]|uniref:Bifunctional isocitrate dehydrogenase kinase/phosphatase n=1 Tax=Algoriphagus halophytocola TaxID=2991499 RepID=A0ABY6MMZ0_9BACT|nr:MULTISPECIES: bifunctional isocitrate dehydrogenase kinase/phosphatase [unclassified Algoriphagus]UZD23696.1 bifunctional isocitrate dehydrogenase kinase/phosphatase [Algoriphagus sp. TR-M5]WBL44989.1 bifunctional isocitrate dehydrogenase kinase/phosphatase [Algoriphagus sp. TR-M9]
MNLSLANQLADKILSGYITYMEMFNIYTRLAPRYFSEKAWHAIQLNHKQRLRLYKDLLFPLAAECKDMLQDKVADVELWKAVKHEFSHLVCERSDIELAETFFNSAIRKIFPKMTVDQDLMFVMEGYESCSILESSDLIRTYPTSLGLEKVLRKILDDYDFGAPFMDKEQDIKFLTESVRKVILTRYRVAPDTKTQILKSVFYRNKAAYLIGRTFLGHKWMPFIIPVMHGPKGVFVDTLIFDPNLMSSMFSFTRSYFMVEAEVPSQIVGFLNSVIPHKKIHELYNAIGFNKHGKTLFYRDFLHHLNTSEDKFEVAPGIKGMVMTVFTLPSLNIVFKLIKDHFEPPKNMTRQEVKDKYKLVSLHDRVGRMADTHEFEYFSIPLDRVSEELMIELRKTTNSLLKIDGDQLVIKHLYTERKMEPLNMFLEHCDTEDGIRAVKGYGRAILQLAQANIFPGDMMTKNFGLTRQRRVIFYDYDEIEFLTDMNFRAKPKAETYEQIYASEPWYDIAKNDVFPEDFRRWMIGRKDIKEEFISYHEKLFDPKHWQEIQQKIRNGELLHAFPYPEEIRFRPEEKI